MSKKIYLFLAFLMFCLNFYFWKEVFVLADDDLNVYFLDVGQGDSAFIKTPENHQIVIDGGPDSKSLSEISHFIPYFDRSLDLVILTHPDADHLVGLISILEKYKADYILWTGVKKNTDEYRKWMTILEEQKKKGSKVIIAKANQKIKAGGLLIENIYPFENFQTKEPKEVNETGIVSHMFFGNNSFLFTGDIGQKSEEKIIQSGINLKSDVLKVPHHGSKYSSSELFLEKIQPQLAIISVGKENRYGHPTKEVLQRLKKFDIETLRTDNSGTIKLKTDGNEFSNIQN